MSKNHRSRKDEIRACLFFVDLCTDVLIDLVHPSSECSVSPNLCKYTLISFNVFGLIDLTQAGVLLQIGVPLPLETT